MEMAWKIFRMRMAAAVAEMLPLPTARTRHFSFSCYSPLRFCGEDALSTAKKRAPEGAR
jgi:hypothetical protein